MEKTLYPRDRILVSKFLFSVCSVEQGDIIVFKSPQTPERDFIKRCVGLRGDVVEVRDKVLYVNGRPFSDPPGVTFRDAPVCSSGFRPGNRDNMGPFTVPGKGTVIQLNEENIALYGDVIEYEGHVLTSDNGGAVHIDGRPVVSYTFAMDHFFMMGDNRDNSQDSRFWKSLPDAYVKGKAIAIYWPLLRMSLIH